VRFSPPRSLPPPWHFRQLSMSRPRTLLPNSSRLAAICRAWSAPTAGGGGETAANRPVPARQARTAADQAAARAGRRGQRAGRERTGGGCGRLRDVRQGGKEGAQTSTGHALEANGAWPGGQGARSGASAIQRTAVGKVNPNPVRGAWAVSAGVRGRIRDGF